MTIVLMNNTVSSRDKSLNIMKEINIVVLYMYVRTHISRGYDEVVCNVSGLEKPQTRVCGRVSKVERKRAPFRAFNLSQMMSTLCIMGKLSSVRRLTTQKGMRHLTSIGWFHIKAARLWQNTLEVILRSIWSLFTRCYFEYDMSHFSYACKTEGENGISPLISETA